MTTHIVFWQLKEQAGGRTKEENALLIKERIEALVGVVPGLIKATVGSNTNGGEYDLALVSYHDSMQALHDYDKHPAHEEVRAFVRNVVEKRAAVDF